VANHSNRRQRQRQQATDSDERDKAEADDHHEVRPQAVEHDALPSATQLLVMDQEQSYFRLWMIGTRLEHDDRRAPRATCRR
jgi:hypothetical protein